MISLFVIRAWELSSFLLLSLLCFFIKVTNSCCLHTFYKHHLFLTPNFPFPMLSGFSCVWLCSHMDCSPPGSSVHGILQARILEWVTISSSRGSSRLGDQTHGSCTSCVAGRLFTTEPPGKPHPFLRGIRFFQLLKKITILSISLNNMLFISTLCFFNCKH